MSLHVKLGLALLPVLPLMAYIAPRLQRIYCIWSPLHQSLLLIAPPLDMHDLWSPFHQNLLLFSALVVFATTTYAMSRRRPVYLLDYACAKPPETLKAPSAAVLGRMAEFNIYQKESLEFQRKIMERSGLGDDTYLPVPLHKVPPEATVEGARAEAEQVMFDAVDRLLDASGCKPREVGILIVNCSIFCPTPSLAEMVVNRYKMREDLRCYNLGGMGCSAGVIAVDMAKRLLQVHGGTYALVVSMENITLNWYLGNNKAMLLPNCLFRMGGAAVLLSNRPSDRARAKYHLVHTVRTHKGSDDRSFSSVQHIEDPQGLAGVALTKDLMAVAGDTLAANITTLGPLVLPISEQLLFLGNLVARKVLHMKLKPYTPDFSLAFRHFCIHAGGRAVIDAIQQNLRLSASHVEPSRMSLHRFGNTSSSSIWYELAYLEAKGRVGKGDRVWQIAFGSGFKCNSAVWRALRHVPPAQPHNPWSDCIHHYPVQACE